MTIAVSAEKARSGSVGRIIVSTFFLLLAVALVPIFSFKLPVLIDYPDHLARIYMLVNLDHDSLLQRFYTFVWHPIPDLGIDLLLPPLVKPFGIFLAGKIFVAFVLIVLTTGVMALQHAVHRVVSPAPLLIFPFLYNQAFLFGFLNYLLAVGIALWAFAAWVWLRQWPPWKRGLVSACFVVALYFSHLYGVALYGFGLLCWEVALLRRNGLQPYFRWLKDAMVFGLPFLPVLVFLYFSPAGSEANEFHFDRTVIEKLFGTLYFLFCAYQISFLLICAVLMGLIGGLLWAIRGARLTLPPAAGYFIVAGAFIWILTPNNAIHSHYVDDRLLTGLLPMALGMVHLRLNRQEAAMFCLAMAALTVARSAEVEFAWQDYEKTVAQLEESFAAMEPGSRVLTAVADSTDAGGTIRTTMHFPELAIIERSSMVSLEFVNPSGQNLRLRPPYQNLAPEAGVPPEMGWVMDEVPNLDARPPQTYWIGWWHKYDYIYALGAVEGTPYYAPELSVAYQGEHFQLLRVRHDPKND